MVVPAVAIDEAQLGSDTPDPTLDQTAPKDRYAPFRLRNLGMSFGGVYACRALDLEFHQGEVHAFVGENGAGKSTTMKCLAGLYAPTEGDVEVDGQPVHLTSPRDAERLGICLIPQELDLFPELSIAENMFLGRDRPHTRWGGFDGAKMKAVARAALDRMGLNLDPRKKVKHLSAANAKIVEIARALTRQARLLIMDEPTASLTEREVARLFQVVRDLRAQGITIIYISHRLDEVFALSDRITVLRDGRHVSTGKTSAFTPSSLVQMMVGRPLEALFTRTFQRPGPVVLSVQGLGRSGRFKDVSFDLRRGEILGFSGLIGAGRTEVALALYGIAPADRGRVTIKDQPVQVGSPRRALELGIGYLPEERRAQALVLPRSIAWNISIACLGRFSHLGLLADKDAKAFAKTAASAVGVRGGSLDTPVSHLSGGNQQKVVLAKTLATSPTIVILDEPTRGVDVGAKSEIYKIIDELAKSGKSVIMISSELNELIAMCDRILVMHEGAVAGIFDREFSAHQLGAAATGTRTPVDGARP